MSDKDKEQQAPEKRFHDGPAKSGRLSRLKRVAWIAFGTSTAAMVVITLFSLVSNRGGLVISLNYRDVANHFTMSLQPRRGEGSSTDDPRSLLIAEPLGDTLPTTNKTIRAYYEAHMSGLAGQAPSGSWNLVDTSTNDSLALFYTFYLTNASLTEAQPFRISGRMNSELVQSPESIGHRPYDYVRLAIFSGEDGKADDTVVYYGAQNTYQLGTEEDPSDTREALANVYRLMDDQGRYYRVSDYSDVYVGADGQEHEIAFCQSFVPGMDGMGLFEFSGVIAPGVSRRITFVSYLEGADPDCDGVLPKGQKLGFALTVGI